MIQAKQGIQGVSSSGKSKLTRHDSEIVMATETKRAKRETQPKRSGLVVPRVFSKAGVNPFDEVEWENRTAEITDVQIRSMQKP